MTTVLMLLMLPIGFYTYFFIEKRTQREYQAVFDNFQESTVSKKISSEEKINLFEQMLLKNGYEVTQMTTTTVVGEKKVLSMAFIMMGLGLYIIGLFFYLAYYFWIQKPHKVRFTV